MTLLYKLTTRDYKTRPGENNECVWGEGVTHSGTGEGDLCGPGYIHAYEDPIIAMLMNPIHAAYLCPVLWEAEGEIAKRDGDLKCGCISLTTLRVIPLPEIAIEQHVEFAIRCALEVYQDPGFVLWANKWLSGEDRSEKAAEMAEARAKWALTQAEEMAKAQAVKAAESAARAAGLNLNMAAAWAAAWAVEASANAANELAWAVENAAARAADVVNATVAHTSFSAIAIIRQMWPENKKKGKRRIRT